MPHADRTASPLDPVLLAGSSPVARRLSAAIESAAAASCVLIESEAGLDTDTVAGAIHAHSRRPGRLVAVECRGVKPPLVERLLFGAGRRASREADAVGANSACAQAHGGTLYLGNVCELSPAAQSRLVRVARGDEMRIDGAGTPARVSIVAATTTDLQARVEDGQFHAELLEQFSQTRIAVPGLRRRVEDLPVIIDALLAEQCAAAGLPGRTVSAPAMSLLSSMPWPGNLVELRHAIAQLVSATVSNVIQVDDVLAHVHFHAALAPHSASGTLRAARRQFERDYIALILRQHHGRVGDAARALGIQRTNLYRKARQLGISVARPVQC
jgi:DNA-binding NtrC family response regulator